MRNVLNSNIARAATEETGSTESAALPLASKVEILTDESAINAIKKAATGGRMRNVHDKFESAAAAFQKGQEECEKHGVRALFNPKLFFRTDESGEVITDDDGNPQMLDSMADSRFAVAVIGARQKNAKGQTEPGIRGLIMFPIPTLAAFIANGESWLAKIAEKEAAHVAFRNLRNATTNAELDAAVDSMPNDVDGFIASYNSGDGLDTETIDAVWSDVRKYIKSEAPQLYGLMPPKAEIIKAIRSASYARQEHPELESRGLFVNVFAALVMKAGEGWKDSDGNADPLDTSAIQEWIDNRETTNIAQRQAAEKDFSALDSLDLGIA